MSAGLSPASVHLAGLLPPPRAAKPPVSRVKLGLLEMSQHELSTIPEVETPGNTSQVTGQLSSNNKRPGCPNFDINFSQNSDKIKEKCAIITFFL